MIEKVGYSKPVGASRNIRKTGSADGVAFASALEAAEGVAAAAPTAPVAAMTGVTGLIGINEVNERDVQRRKAIKRGRFTLDALSQLRDALLMGSVPIATLKNLERLVAEERALTDNPALNAIMDEIELRAAVEIAKLEVAGLLPPAN